MLPSKMCSPILVVTGMASCCATAVASWAFAWHCRNRGSSWWVWIMFYPNLRKMIQVDSAYFSIGLKPPSIVLVPKVGGFGYVSSISGGLWWLTYSVHWPFKWVTCWESCFHQKGLFLRTKSQLGRKPFGSSQHINNNRSDIFFWIKIIHENRSAGEGLKLLCKPLLRWLLNGCFLEGTHQMPPHPKK